MSRRKKLRNRRQRPRKRTRRRTHEPASTICTPPQAMADRARKLRQRLQQDGATVVDGPVPGEETMSGLILELVEDELEGLSPDQREARLEGTAAVAILGWNAAVSCARSDERLEEHLRRKLDDTDFEPPARDRIFEMAHRIAVRKLWWYPDDDRFICDMQFTRDGDEAVLNICSVAFA